MGRFEEPNMGLPILGSQYLVNYITSGLCNITDDSKEKMEPRKDEGSYWGNEEQGTGQLHSVQSFQLPTNNTTELC